MGAELAVGDFATAGIKKNRKLEFSVRFSGKDFYRLLSFLERMAEDLKAYPQIETCVLFSRSMREQLRTQGF